MENMWINISCTLFLVKKMTMGKTMIERLLFSCRLSTDCGVRFSNLGLKVFNMENFVRSFVLFSMITHSNG